MIHSFGFSSIRGIGFFMYAQLINILDFPYSAYCGCPSSRGVSSMGYVYPLSLYM